MLLRRGFASAAAQASKPNPLIEPIQLKTSRLPNGMTVSSVDLQGAVTQLVFAFRSGSRYQQPDEGGLAHLLRNSVGTDSDNYLGLKLLWESAQTGANINSRLSKDLHCVHMSVTRTQASIALSILGELVQPAVKPWEILNVDAELETDMKHQTAEQICLENVHRAAFRNGSLAQPLLAAPYEIGSEGSNRYKKLANYVLSRWKTGESALIGVNVDHSLLLEYATEQLPVPDGSAQPADPSPFLGGDVRQRGGGQTAHVAIVGQGAAAKDEKAVAVQAVLSALIGQNGNYTNNANIAQPSVVHKSVHKAANHHSFTLAPISLSYVDNGLAGFYLAADGAKIYSCVKAGVQGLRELAANSVDAELLEIAKQTVTMKILTESESTEQLALDQAIQVLAKGAAQSPAEQAQQVKQVTAEDVKKAASQLCAKLALSAYGNVHQVPYLDEM